jgi:hypothetical protein
METNGMATVMTKSILPCARTEILTPLSEGYFLATIHDSYWSFVCEEAAQCNANEYAVPVAAMSKSSEDLIYWLTHLHSLRWFDIGMFLTFMYIMQDEIERQNKSSSTQHGRTESDADK